MQVSLVILFLLWLLICLSRYEVSEIPMYSYYLSLI